MRFFLDENVNQLMIEHLSSIFRAHEFVGVRELGTKGLEDVELFGEVADHPCQVFVTGDLAQLRRPEERAACRVAGLHWIGIHQVHAKGYHSVADPLRPSFMRFPSCSRSWPVRLRRSSSTSANRSETTRGSSTPRAACEPRPALFALRRIKTFVDEVFVHLELPERDVPGCSFVHVRLDAPVGDSVPRNGPFARGVGSTLSA
ncbi:hypothetical protein GS532_18835 [Rhodococcus hoagii]|nr:hypothetical protein [Prescottella equi]